jgi:hypothetical protein
VQAFAAGNVHDFDIKFITPLRWKHAGGERQLSLLVVRPIAYRLRKGAHLSYRNPAYVICSDPALAPQQILQAYLWRWEILCRAPHLFCGVERYVALTVIGEQATCNFTESAT